MCGIFCLVQKCKTECHINKFPFLPDLLRRGPDHYGWTCPVCPSDAHAVTDGQNSAYFAHVASSVLHIRGAEATQQPLVDAHGNVLAWNGEVFRCSETSKLVEHSSDTIFVSECLAECDCDFEVWRFFCQLEGPFAFVYYHRSSNAVYFGRDQLGRRSLLWARTSGHFTLSSVFVPVKNHDMQGTGDDVQEARFGEVPASGLFKLSLDAPEFIFSFLPWTSLWDFRLETDLDFQLLQSYNDIRICDQDVFRMELVRAVDSNSSVVSVMGSYLGEEVSTAVSPLVLLKALLDIAPVLSLVSKFERVLRNAILRRVENSVRRCKGCLTACGHAKVAVLFSGGLDSMVMARLILDFIPPDDPLDLLNVAFVPDDKPEAAEIAPDRISGQRGFNLLCEMYPSHSVHFVRINITKTEADQTRKERLWRLILPQNSVLDSSISTALWFAARGEGVLIDKANEIVEPYTSPARVIFSGLGADELLGGYSRHRTQFARGGPAAVEQELQMDLRRISSRNCGRDDRVISDHGREVRYPYLDENVVLLLRDLPLRAKCDLSLARGVGDKLLLRLLSLKLGLGDVAVLEKRAMQFGTRIAKIDQTKNGFSVSSQLADAKKSFEQ